MKKLKIFENFNIPNKFKKSIILIGNFDGLHSGHQKLFELAKKYKTKYKSKVGVVTFDPIPKMFFNTKIKNYRISNFNQKVIYLKKFGVDFVINKKFDKNFSKITYYEFIKNNLENTGNVVGNHYLIELTSILLTIATFKFERDFEELKIYYYI